MASHVTLRIGGQLHQMVVMGPNEQFLAVRDVQLTENVGEVMADRDVANGEPMGNLFVSQSNANKPNDFPFARRETIHSFDPLIDLRHKGYVGKGRSLERLGCRLDLLRSFTAKAFNGGDQNGRRLYF
jgi:hypothetical protein